MLPESDILPGEPSPKWLPVAQLLRPQGRRGEVLAIPLTDRLEVFAAGRNFLLKPENSTLATARPVRLESCWQPQGRNAGRIVLKLAAVDSINAAEALGKSVLLLDEADLPPLAQDMFFVRDLVGCALFNSDVHLGTIIAVQFPTAADGHTRLQDAADLLEVQLQAAPEAESVLIPFVKAWLVSTDFADHRIVMRLPPGLVETPENDSE